LVARSRKLRELHGLEPDVIPRETFAMPLHAASLQTRKIIDEHQAGRCMKIVETGASFPKSKLSSRCDGFRRGMS
jgi:hypothetical protein